MPRPTLTHPTYSDRAPTSDAASDAGARHPPAPAALQDVALLTATACAAAAQISVSHWHALVAEGKAPAPVVRQPRFTRWRQSHIRAWLTAFGGGTTPAAAEPVTAATKTLEASAPTAWRTDTRKASGI